MTAKFTCKKIDKRYRGGKQFKYLLEPEHRLSYGNFVNYRERCIAFSAAREWCWTTFGPTVELSGWADETNPHFNTKWSFLCEKGKLQIFINDEKDFSLFLLKWL